ncbi:haloacid dehalogenase [Alkalihalobacillus alcalophilus ATCC 27647 = CGMCC 1.3604]|uniref:Phosphoserine phosphatase n=1 Tax=Alkalihalobacillus alcalophilus ATCC 27647 = CGMCC 1.3604 TaxID=1218173 RepID=A0A094XCM8_ALKAL|nr:haloacid dehalogenase [Alkalihalobacillus alcalophilus ATCC 27647 = CGMCC 1.3604]MED1564137.1 HAD family hydrolase [Alkalihalobacillus alcalophilus]THG91852.1 haloacid dehalogenase [Alkalihalobacillus alcalophilus ATCC 27647 = CGMCC 1.3604]
MLKAIFFDLDDTLLWDKKSIQTAFEKTCQLVEDKYGISASGFEEVARKKAKDLYKSYETYEFTQLIGINPFEGLWGKFEEEHPEFKKMNQMVSSYHLDTWKSALKMFRIEDEEFARELVRAFRKNRKENPFLYEESLEVLERLKKEYRLLLLTNGSPQLQTTKLEITPELRPFFEKIIISGDFGQGKPEPAIFQFALKEMNVTNEEVLMVGDNLMTDILGANRTGIKSVWLNREEKERNEVEPSYEIKDLHELFPLLEKLSS